MLDWPEPGQTKKGKIDGPAGALEVEVQAPEAASVGVGVVCHPHPQHGGSKDNKVVFAAARACREAGLTSVRFNFRGIGASDGDYDEGRGEVDDALAVAQWALEHADAAQLVWAGFSFGAAVALRACVAGETPTKPLGLVTIALPTEYFDNDIDQPDCPWLAVYGDADEVVDPDAARDRLAALSSPPDVETLADAGHFFHGRLNDLGDAIAPYLSQWLGASEAASDT